jgi:hypothetical protein
VRWMCNGDYKRSGNDHSYAWEIDDLNNINNGNTNMKKNNSSDSKHLQHR